MRKITGTWKAKSPISHNADTSLSTTTLFRKQKMITADNEVVDTPIITGNGTRGLMRRLLMKELMLQMGVEPRSLTPDFYYILFSGGFIAKGASGRYDLAGLKQKIREYVPAISLLGTAFGAQTMDGKVNVGIAYPLCKEIKHIISDEVPEEYLENTFWVYLDEIFYTRHDDLEEPNDTVTQMKYEIESLAPGTLFYHEIIDETDTEIEAACLRKAIELFIENGQIGGKKSIGHGKIEVDYNGVEDLPDSSVYDNFIDENRKEIEEVFDTIAEQAGLAGWKLDEK